MTVNPRLHDAEAVFRELGWDTVSPSDAPNMPLGSPEQQKRAIAGLKTGDWSVYVEEEGFRGGKSVLNVNQQMLAMFAIRVGVPTRRTVDLLYRVPSSLQFAVMREHTPAQIADFIQAACRSDRRAWEHSLTVLGSVAVALVTRLDLEVPQNLEYLKDWAAIAAWNVAEHPIEATAVLEDVPTLAELTPSFRAHLDAALAFNVPATGPFGYVLPGAVNAGLLTRDEGVALAFDALTHAVRPGDRKQWVKVLRESLQVSDAELLEHFDLLVPVIATGEAAMVEAVALPLIPLANDEQLGELALCSLYATTAKAKKAVIRALTERPRPSAETVEMCAPRLQEMAQTRDAALVKQIRKVLDAWGADSTSDSEAGDANGPATEKGAGLWQETPPLWEAPRWSPPAPSFDALSEALAAFVHQPEGDATLEGEAFLSAAIELSYADPEEAKRALQGCPQNLLDGAPYDWAREGALEWNPYTSYEPSPYYVRPRALLYRMGTLPCVLSAPSFVDFTLTLEDLRGRLERYAQAGVPVLASDLVTALTRLDIRDMSVAEVQATVGGYDVPVVVEDGRMLGRSAGQVVADYVADPIREPGYTTDDSAWSGWEKDSFVIPASLEGFPLSFWYYPALSEFPLWSVATSFGFTWSSEVSLALGLNALQVARSHQPLSPQMAINLLACQRPSKKAEVTADCAQALRDAWSRGLLIPGVADVTYMDWQRPLSNIASFAAAMRECAHEGVLSVIWPVCDDLLSYALAQARMPAGIAEVADVMAEFAPAVAAAVAAGTAPAEALAVPGLRAMAARAGSSKAVAAARDAVRALPEAPQMTGEGKAAASSSSGQTGAGSAAKTSLVPLADEEFAQQWPVPAGADPGTFTADAFLSEQERKVWDDGVRISAVQVGDVPGRRAIRLDMAFPGRSDILEVVEVGWFHGLVTEGQVKATVRAAEGDKPQRVWVHWNGGHDWAFSPVRNWRCGNDAPLEGEATPLSPTLVAVVVAAQCFEGETYYARMALSDFAAERLATPAMVAEAMRRLLPYEAFSPARAVYVPERKPSVLPLWWPILTESLRAAGDLVSSGQKPPRWANSVLNVVQAHAQLLISATLRGFIPRSEWEGFHMLAAAGKKSAARDKAQALRKLFESVGC